jgi:tetrapyrrole methylase family protein/MazG family protein
MNGENMLDFQCQDQYRLEDFVRLISYLRSEQGCPWDQVQTHQSIRRNFIEEVYEACEALDADDKAHMCEELGDVLMQVLFHTDIEREAGSFDIDDVANTACKKLVNRHPHVFGTPEQRAAGFDWDAEKRKERGQSTIAQTMEGVSKALPSLWRAEKIQSKAAKAGFDWRSGEEAFAKLPEETRELQEAIRSQDVDAIEEELGDLLFAVVKVARFQGVDPEKAAHRACEKFTRRFSMVEKAASEAGKMLSELSFDELDALYQAEKAQSAQNI